MRIAVDIAILPPSEVSERAIALSAALPVTESQGLRLGADVLPHITLTQQFVPHDSLEPLIERVARVLLAPSHAPSHVAPAHVAPSHLAPSHLAPSHLPLHLRVIGGGKGSNSVWMSIERTPALVDLHERLLQATGPFEAGDGDAAAFVGDARDRDVRWVREFRRQSSYERFTPHITLGHASEPPLVAPMDFVATRVAICHLGRFCTCRRIIRHWDLAWRSDSV